MVVPSIRAAILFIGLALATCLPSVAAEWLFPISVAGPVARPADAPLIDESAATTREDGRSLPGDARADEPRPAPPHLYDVHGNEIVLPVARYGVDPQGSLYELHSPYTELPRLEPPEL